MEAGMRRIVIREISEQVYQELCRRAAEHGAAPEAEALGILTRAIRDDGFVLPCLLQPKETGGDSLATLVSQGRRWQTLQVSPPTPACAWHE